MSRKLQILPASDFGGDTSIASSDLGTVFECVEEEKDCVVIMSTVQPTEKQTVFFALFAKPGSALIDFEVDVEWSAKISKSLAYPPAVLHHAYALVPEDVGPMQIVVKVTGPATRSFTFVVHVRRSYPLFKYLEQMTDIHDQWVTRWAFRQARYILATSPATLGLSLVLYIRRPEELTSEIRKNSGLLARKLVRDPVNVSLDGSRAITGPLISDYSLYFDAALKPSIGDELHPPKELLIGIVTVLFSKSQATEMDAVGRGNELGRLLRRLHGNKAPPLAGPLLHRLAAVAWVAGSRGLSEPTAASVAGGDLMDAERSLVNDRASLPARRAIDLLVTFPMSAVSVVFALLTKIKSNNIHNSMTTDQLLADEEAMKDIAGEYFRLIVAPELRGNSTAFDEERRVLIEDTVADLARIAAKTAQLPESKVIEHGGLLARLVLTEFDSTNNRVTRSLDYAHPLTTEFPWVLKYVPKIGGADPTQRDTPAWSIEHFGWDSNKDVLKANLDGAEDWEMVLLDVGFWGHYDLANPQRNFGMIEGRHVWLCSLIYSEDEVKSIHGETLARFRKVYRSTHPNEQALAERVVMELAKWGYTIEVISYALAPDPPNPQSVSDSAPILQNNKFKVILPDMHLPEQWPDIPHDGARVERSDLRNALRGLLESTQILNHDDLEMAQITKDGQREAVAVHDYLVACIHYVRGETANSPGTFHVRLPGISEEVQPEEFYAEYRYLERKIRLNANWFYPPSSSEPSTLESSEEVRADPSPAIDLAAFLTAIVDLNSSNIELFHVGDLYEMWMGLEWLYKDFPSHPKQKISAMGISLLIDRTGGPGAYQYRLGKDWHSYNGWQKWINQPGLVDTKRSLQKTDGQYLDDSIPMYCCHEWPASQLTERRLTGLSLASNDLPLDSDAARKQKKKLRDLSEVGVEQLSVVDRAQTEINRRITSIESFSLPWPETDDWGPDEPERSPREAISKLKERYWEVRNDNLESFRYRRLTETGEEFLWNRLVIDLLKNSHCTMINGNHDCYRGDPVLKNMSLDWGANSWFSDDGIWIEHGHRWDAYNQDGMPFGAAVTNQAHYNMRPFTQFQDKAQGAVLPKFHKETIPSCAQWFLTVNGNIENGKYVPTSYFEQEHHDEVRPFSVYVVGHSHTPDLLTVKFRKEGV